MPTINVTPQNEDITEMTHIEEQQHIPEPEEQTEQQQVYNEAELNDPEAIDVTIADEETPIVVLFGPPACGKTMTLIRLAEFLTNRGYTVEPVRSFRSSHDRNYSSNCDGFNKMLNNLWAAEKSLGLNFMLLNVSKGGHPIVQILEAPGGHYYNPDDPGEPHQQFISYIDKIINAVNQKVWVYMTEPNWKNQNDRIKYARKVSLMKKKTSSNDKSIIVFNKIDTTQFVIGKGMVNQKDAEKHINNMYPGLFDCFINPNPITSLWKPYTCTFVPFTTGTYRKLLIEGKERQKYTQGADAYPLKLWNMILKSIGLPQIQG